MLVVLTATWPTEVNEGPAEEGKVKEPVEMLANPDTLRVAGIVKVPFIVAEFTVGDERVADVKVLFDNDWVVSVSTIVLVALP